jgi:hypothetical protein
MIKDPESVFGIWETTAVVERRSRTEKNQRAGVNATTDDVPNGAMLAGERDQNDCSQDRKDESDATGDAVRQLLTAAGPGSVHFVTDNHFTNSSIGLRRVAGRGRVSNPLE